MKLARLEIGRLPGLAPHARIVLADLHPETTVVVGPNASGKSSLVRALRALLAPPSVPGSEVDVAAEFVDGAHTWRAERFGTTTVWRRDGHVAEPPPLPDATTLACYALAAEDLVRAGDTDAEIGAAIAREAAGGYDLPAVRDAPAFRVTSHAANVARRAYDAAAAGHDEVLAEMRDLRRDEAERDRWTEERDEAAAAAREAARLRDAAALAARVRDAAAADARLAAFPRGMDRLTGREAERVDRLRGRLRELDAEAAAARDRRAAAVARVRDSGLADVPLAKDELEARLADAARLATLDDEVERATRAVAAARHARDRATEALAGVPRVGPVPGPDAVQATERAAARLRDTRARLAATRARADDLGRRIAAVAADDVSEADAQDRVTRLREARARLAAWHAAATVARAAAPHRRRTIVAAVTAGVAAAAAVVAAGVAGAATDDTYLLVAAALAGLVALVAGVGAGRPGAVERAALRDPPDAELAALRVEGPDAWRHADVARRLTELDADIARWHVAALHAAERDALAKRQADDAANADEDEAALAAVAARAGLDPTGLDASLLHALARLRAADDADRAAAAAEGELADAVRRRDAARDAVATFLGRFGPDAPDADATAAGLAARLRALARRLDDRDEGAREAEAADADARRIARDRARTEVELRDLHHEVGTEGDAELARRLERLDAWRAARDAADRASADLRAAEVRLADRPDLTAEALRGDPAPLEARAADADRRAGTYDEHAARIASLDARIERAKGEGRLAERRAAWDAAEDALRAARDEAVFAAAGAFLLDDVAREHASERVPRVLGTARSGFARFTRHRYALAFDPEAGPGARFSARETATGRHLRLGELSTATRMHALLAVRAAYATEAEAGRAALPLVLDEALATTDAERFHAVAEALGALARGGRQVLYLSSRHEDAAAWRAAVGAGCAVVELGHDAASRHAPVDAARLRASDPPDVPDPDAMDVTAFAARIGVPAVDGWADAAALHPFHLLRDRLPLLARLLRAGANRVGPALGLLDAPGWTEVATPDERARLGARAAAAQAWLEAWRVGRGRPVPRAFFAASEAVGDAFVARIETLNDELDGDAAALLDAIDAGRLPRFRQAQRERLEAELDRAGHLPRGARLGSAARLARMAAALHSGAAEAPEALAELEAALAVGLQAALSPRDPASRPAARG